MNAQVIAAILSPFGWGVEAFSPQLTIGHGLNWGHLQLARNLFAQ